MLLIQANRILMVLQTHRGETFWTLPGGSIGPDETPEAAAIREAREEAGLEIEIVRRLYQIPRTNADGWYYCYLGRIVGGKLALGSDPELPDSVREIHQVRWFPLDQMYQHPEVAWVLAARSRVS